MLVLNVGMDSSSSRFALCILAVSSSLNGHSNGEKQSRHQLLLSFIMS